MDRDWLALLVVHFSEFFIKLCDELCNEFPLQPIDLVREPFRVLNTNNQSWKMNKNKSESGLSFRNKKKFQIINTENTEFYDVCYFHWSEFGEHDSLRTMFRLRKPAGFPNRTVP